MSALATLQKSGPANKADSQSVRFESQEAENDKQELKKGTSLPGTSFKPFASQPSDTPPDANDNPGINFNRIPLFSGNTPFLQTKLTVNQPGDQYEREADAMADKVMRMADKVMRMADIGLLQNSNSPGNIIQRKCAHCEDEDKKKVQRKESGAPVSVVSPVVGQTLRSSGQPLDTITRSFMEPRFGIDFSKVRIHNDSHAQQSAREINALAYTHGNNIVFNSGQYSPESDGGKRLLAHELTHVVQQSENMPRIQRKVKVLNSSSALPSWQEMGKKERKDFLHKFFSHNNLAQRVIEDMAHADDSFWFSDENELKEEITKRVSTSTDMQESQVVHGAHKMAFGYPFTGDALFYGPRVNFAAKDYWTPAVVDNYAIRSDKAKQKAIRALPRSSRHQVYGDPDDYEWALTDAGKLDPFDAIMQLFIPQPAHKRSLIHCDYLISMVQVKAFAELIGKTSFNSKVIAFGADKIRLKWNAFTDFDINALGGAPNPIGTLQTVRPTSEEDLVIGDHVIFWNHISYDLINEKIGNAWRLENAILIDKRKGEDIFLGHGSGRKTKKQMKEKLAEEYNDVATRAISLSKSSTSKHKPDGSVLSTDFPKIKKVSAEWRVKGSINKCPAILIDKKLERITFDKVIGLKDPCDATILNRVRRPQESR